MFCGFKRLNLTRKNNFFELTHNFGFLFDNAFPPFGQFEKIPFLIILSLSKKIYKKKNKNINI